MIIYGWGYFNRRDHSVVRTTCPGCGRRDHLPSYTASKFFTLYFIPLIPLGTQKILSECLHCKQARMLSLRKWNQLRKTELPAAIAAYEASPANAEAAKNVLGTIIGLQDRAALRRVGPQIRRAFATDAGLTRFLAGTYDHLCMDKEADEAYLAAMSLSDDADIAAEASLHMETQKLPKPAPPNRLLQSLPVLIVPGALLFALTLFVQRAATASVQDGYVLSGLNRPYSAFINGRKVALAPYQRIPAPMLRYGENEIAPAPESPFIAATTFRVDAPWYQRPFSGPLVVVNPDRAAVMLWERTGYASDTRNVPTNAYQYKLAGGRAMHVYHDIDFPFRDFPQTITMPQGSSLTYRYRVSEVDAQEPQRTLQLLLGNQQAEDANNFVRAWLRVEVDNPGMIFAGLRMLPRDEFLQLAEPRLAERPVLVEWHRAYQNAVENKPEGHDLVARYRTLAQQEPDKSAVRYLLSRVLDDPDEAIALLRQAAATPQPTGYAAFGLAYRHIIEGEFNNALDRSEEALRLMPKNEQFQQVRRAALYGLQKFEQVETEAGNPMLANDASITALFDHLYRLAKLGRSRAALEEIPAYLKMQQKDEALPADRVQWMTSYLQTAVAVARHDRDTYLAAAARVDLPSWRLQQAILSREFESAVRLAAESAAGAGPLDHLTLYVLLQRANHATEAATELEKAATALEAGGAVSGRWAAWLRGEVAPDARLAAHTCEDPDNQGVYLCALAQRFPTRASEYLERAAKMKYLDNFYSLALHEVMAR